MRNRRRRLPIAVAISSVLWAVATATPGASQALADDIAEGLAADRPIATRAFVAVKIGQQRLVDAAPVLLDTIVKVRQPKTNADRAFVHAALDALMLTGAPLDPTAARGLADLPAAFAPAIVGLLERDRARHAGTLLRLLDHADVAEPLLRTVVDMSLETKPAGFAAVLMRHMPPEIEVYIEAPDSAVIGLGGAFSSSRASGSLEIPDDFPAFGIYHLTTVRGKNRKRLTGRGGNAVYLHRVPTLPGKRTGLGRARSASLDARIRTTALAELAGISRIELAKKLARGGRVAFEDERQLRKALIEIRDNTIAGAHAVAALLVARNLMTKDEARALEPTIEVHLRDTRRNANPPLPRLDPRTLRSLPPRGDVRIGRVSWYSNYDQAREVAKRFGKPLFLHFGENPG